MTTFPCVSVLCHKREISTATRAKSFMHVRVPRGIGLLHRVDDLLQDEDWLSVLWGKEYPHEHTWVPGLDNQAVGISLLD